MARSGTVADTISARPLFIVPKEASYIRKVFLTTINWSHDNRKGMTFGVAFAAILLTLLSYIPLPKRSGRYANTLYGFFVGAPLGVCVNCAAPVFKGILQSERIETAFAAMLSSPTMNIVVLTMTFTFFPFYLAMTKVLFALVTIFIGVPLISRALGPKHPIKDLQTGGLAAKFLTPQAPKAEAQTGNESWPRAFTEAGKALTRNLWFMISRTVPLMLVAGFLGAALSHWVPVNVLADSASPATVVLAAVIGVLLPVPMAFDVMLANALYAHGAPVAIVMTLLCTLGIYSLYSAFITWQSASRQWAAAIMALLVAMGSVVGLAAPYLHEVFYLQPNLSAFRSAFAARGFDEESAIDRVSKASVPPQGPVQPALVFTPERSVGDVSVSSSPLAAPISAVPPGFRRLEGHEIGLTRGFRYGIRDYPDPFWIGRGTAAGDFNGDGWQDLVFGTDHGVALYANRGGWFEEQPDLLPQSLNRLNVYAVALIDFDNDGWLDLFISTFGQGNFILLNRAGTFAASEPVPVPNNGAILTISPGFADLDRDGTIDVVNGNMALGVVTGFNVFARRRGSSVAFNHALDFSERLLGGDDGETMSTLITDINADGHPDLILGHDFIYPDAIWLGDGKGGFQPQPVQDGPAATPVFTMGLDSGDLNNDLKPDLLMTGTIDRAPWVGGRAIDGVAARDYALAKDRPEICLLIKDPVARANCSAVRNGDHLLPFYQNRNLSMASCKDLPDTAGRQDCLLSVMWLMMTNEDQRWDCQRDFAGDQRLLQVCQFLRGKGLRRSPNDFPNTLPQVDGNYVYLAGAGGHWTDINASTPAGTARPFEHPGGWTWHARIADLDNDGWQDIFNAEGAVRTNDYGFNTFMKNVEGKRFEQKQFTYHLDNDFNLHSFAMIDINNDGALDIVGNSSTGPIQVYLNQATGGHHALMVSLRDHQGNRNGIGARIFIEHTGGTGHQMREIKASGGYLSFDPLIAHFGLGAADRADSIRVVWRDGKETVLPGPWPAGKHYLLERR